MIRQSIKILWEERSLKFGKRIEGVLPKSWPKTLNRYLDAWTYQPIRKQISGKKLKILDLGCGYGRLSRKILANYPHAATYGIDLARGYVDIYNKDLSPRGKAVVGDIRRLPFKNDFFDVVFMVTTLMYLPGKKDQRMAVKEIFRVLSKGGKFVVIERNPLGHKIINLFGLVPLLRGKVKREIDSVSFGKDYLANLINDGGGRVEFSEGLPFFTLFFYPLFFLARLNVGGSLLKLVKRMDGVAGRSLLTLSLYISYSGNKP